MKRAVLCKYGEIILKGANKSRFESTLLKEVKRRAHEIGNFRARYIQSTMYVEPLDEYSESRIDDMYYQIKHVFGFAGVCTAMVCEKDMDAIKNTVKEFAKDIPAGGRTFKAIAKRSDKTFPLTSPQVAAEAGAAVLEVCPYLTVDLEEPDMTVYVEIRDQYAYIHGEQDKGAGGLPLGSSGKGLLLLSGGIDSPVAGHMMLKRGLYLDALYFESSPYTSLQAREKVLSLAGKLAEYSGRLKVHIISLTHIQEEMRAKCNEEYFTILLRRFMMNLATKCAKEFYCSALVTGESLGQVASQTMQAMTVTGAETDLPIFRPCIGMDKDEIVKIARAIETFDISILPYEDCCTVFTPRHPKTLPSLEKVLEEEAKLDREGLLKEAYASLFTVPVYQFKSKKEETEA